MENFSRNSDLTVKLTNHYHKVRLTSVFKSEIFCTHLLKNCNPFLSKNKNLSVSVLQPVNVDVKSQLSFIYGCNSMKAKTRPITFKIQ